MNGEYVIEYLVLYNYKMSSMFVGGLLPTQYNPLHKVINQHGGGGSCHL